MINPFDRGWTTITNGSTCGTENSSSTEKFCELRRSHQTTNLSGLKLANPVNGNQKCEIALLIAVGYYWKIVGDKVIREKAQLLLSWNTFLPVH